MTELRDDELLPQTPQEVLDALGFDPRDLDEARESAVGIMPGSVPNLTGWPRQRSMLGESDVVARRRVQETVAADDWAVVLEGDSDRDHDEHPSENDDEPLIA